MEWLVKLFTDTDSVAHIALLYAVVIAIGVYLGKLKIGGISLGVTFVLFAGIVAGHIGFTAPTPILTFVQDFGLILFVFMIGMQVGPGFFESFGTAGIKLNGLAASAILLNILVMFACYFTFFDTSVNTNLPMMVGTLYGAVTNTPGLGAANEALGTIFGSNAPQIASAYACAYPLGVLGIIGATILVRYLCKVKLEKEEEQLTAMEEGKANKKPYKMHLEVTNKYLEGKTLLQVHDFLNRDFVVSRLVHEGELCIPNRNTVFHLGDQMLIVCAESELTKRPSWLSSARSLTSTSSSPTSRSSPSASSSPTAKSTARRWLRCTSPACMVSTSPASLVMAWISLPLVHFLCRWATRLWSLVLKMPLTA